jgi:hypothetical protein
MMNIDVGSTLLLLLSLAMASAPVVVRSLNRIAHVTTEELKLKQERQDEGNGR